jgi:hypothetical protein
MKNHTSIKFIDGWMKNHATLHLLTNEYKTTQTLTLHQNVVNTIWLFGLTLHQNGS